MKGLRFFLAFIFAALIILLLLLRNCDNKHHRDDWDDDDEEEEVVDSIPTPPVKIKETFKADVVMCIDITGSMESIINTIKNNATTFYSDIKSRCLKVGKDVKDMRIKVIGFRDYGGTDSAFEQSAFFHLPSEDSAFRSFVAGLRASGGGDGPEIGYDALAHAMKSGWSGDDNTHQIIILWTDAASHPVGRAPELAKDYGELTSMWNKMSKRGKRLILFAPKHETWQKLANEWDNVALHEKKSGGGLTDTDYDEILRALSESM